MRLEQETSVYKNEDIADGIAGAKDLAIAAQTSADGKNTVYYSAIAPTGGSYANGDIWFDTANDNAIHTWNGNQWIKFELGEDAIANLSITNAKIADATIQSAKIANIDAGKITAGTLDASQVNITNLNASNIASGTMSANRINGGTLTLGGANNGHGTLNILDANGDNAGTWDNTGLKNAKVLQTAEDKRILLKFSYGAKIEDTEEDVEARISVEPNKIRGVTNNTAYARIRYARFTGTTKEGWDFAGINHAQPKPYGWYMSPLVYCERLYTSGGEVATFDDMQHSLMEQKDEIEDAILGTAQTSTRISGINGRVRLGMAMLYFANFSIAANTATNSTAYQLPEAYWPEMTLDLVSTINQFRFLITTDGYIRPTSVPTSNQAIRGTFTYFRPYNINSRAE